MKVRVTLVRQAPLTSCSRGVVDVGVFKQELQGDNDLPVTIHGITQILVEYSSIHSEMVSLWPWRVRICLDPATLALTLV